MRVCQEDKGVSPVEVDLLDLNLTLLDVDLVTDEDDRNVLTHTLEITIPDWYILVSNATSHVKHDDGTLALDVVTVTETTKLLLASSIPHVEAEGTTVGVEVERVHLARETIENQDPESRARGRGSRLVPQHRWLLRTFSRTLRSCDA